MYFQPIVKSLPELGERGFYFLESGFQKYTHLGGPRFFSAPVYVYLSIRKSLSSKNAVTIQTNSWS